MEPLFSVEELAKEDPIMELRDQIEELMRREVIKDVDKLLQEIECVTVGQLTHLQKIQVEETAVSLWNWTTTRDISCGVMELQKAQLYHIACRLMTFCEYEDSSEDIERLILMAVKTGRSYLELAEYDLSDEFFETALDNLEKLYDLLTKRSDSETDICAHKVHVERGVFRVLSFQAELAIAQGDHQKAVTCVLQCKDILLRLPKKARGLFFLCYNFGVKAYALKKYEESTFWLCQSYEIGKMVKKYSADQEMLAKVLRFLSTVYLEWGNKEYLSKALTVVTMANEENLHSAGLFLKIKILLKCEVLDEELDTAVAELLQHEFTLDFYLDVAKLLLAHKRQTIVLDFLEAVTCKFEGSPEAAKVIVLRIELLIEKMSEPLAEKMIKDIIKDHNKRKKVPAETLERLHRILWDRAAKYYKAEKYFEALQWYTYSHDLFFCGEIDKKVASLQRNMAACFLRLKEPLQAKKEVMEAEMRHSNCMFTQFYFFKIAILEKDMQAALDALDAMEKAVTNPDGDTLMAEQSLVSLLKLSSLFALENKQWCAAVKALEYLSLHLQDCGLITANFKCLVPLKLSGIAEKTGEEIIADLEDLLKYMTAAYHRFDEDFIRNNNTLRATRVTDAQWFKCMAWNLATLSGNCLRLMRDLFLLSYKFSEFCTPDETVLQSQRICMFMTVAIELDIGRSSSLPGEQNELLKEALQHIDTCWKIEKLLEESGDLPQDPAAKLLLLYEFEARAKLNDPSLASFLNETLEKTEMDIKMLETIATLAMEPPAYYPSLSKKALSMVLRLLRNHEPFDVLKFSKCIHSLIELSLPSDVTETDVHVLEESRRYFEDVLDTLDSGVLHTSYPEEEVYWLMDRAWNVGVYSNSISQYKQAERWCHLAISFLPRLLTRTCHQETEMLSFYHMLLDKLQSPQNSI